MNMQMIDMLETGKRIYELRIESKMSVKDIQEAFKFESPQTVYKWQKGGSLPSIDNLLNLAKLFELRLNRTIKVEDIIVTKESGFVMDNSSRE